MDLARAIADHELTYFLGTVVTIPGDAGRLEVIDGQQRLATVTVLLCQIQRYLRGRDDVLVQDLELFLRQTDRAQRAIVPRLQLNHADNDFFGKMLDGTGGHQEPQPANKSHRLIAGAFHQIAKYIETIVRAYEATEHGDTLTKWIDFLEFGADVILLQVPSGGNAYKMFETLNDRGLKTTQADLVKNYLFSQAGHRLGEAQHAWSEMRGALESLHDEDKEDVTVTFLRHALMCTDGFVRRNEVFETVQRRGKGAQASVGFLSQVQSLSAAYVATFYRDHEHWRAYPDAAREGIQAINFINIHPFRPVLLAIADKFKPDYAERAYKYMISLGVRLLIASSTRTGSVEEALARAAHGVFDERITTSKGLKEELRDITPSDERFRQAFELATVSSAKLARYYLRTLERAVHGEAGALFVVSDDKEAVTLEHVLPRETEGNWPLFTPDEAEAYWKRIGNMVLLERKTNSDLKSVGWVDKRAQYAGHAYRLTAEVAEVAEWDKRAICDRQAQMAILAVKAWPA